jgi:hypothetical protein
MSKSMKQWFKSHDILLLYHPPSFPYLNPIKPVWHELKMCLWGLPHSPNTIRQLKAAVLCIWDELPIRDIDKHVNRMPDCVEVVWAAKAGHTEF